MSSLATFHFVEIETSDQQSRLSQDRENASRPAIVEIQQESSGTGQYRLSKPVIFPIVFRSEPHFTYGSAVIHALNPKVYHDPRGTSGVWGWKRDGAGYYLGAYLWLRVDCDPINPSVPVVTSGPSGPTGPAGPSPFVDDAATRKAIVRHYLTFSGVAIKAMPTQKLTPSLTPRTVGL